MEEFFAKLLEWLKKVFTPTPKNYTLLAKRPELGDEGEWVKIYQQAIKDRGMVLTADGKFGPVTRQRTTEFELKSGMLPTGLVSDQLLEILSLKIAPKSISEEPELIPPSDGNWKPVLLTGVKSPRRLHPTITAKVLNKMVALFGEDFRQAVLKKDCNKIRAMAGMALAELKIREKTNANDGPDVEQIQYTAYGQKGWAWCMYKDQFCTAIAEYLTGVVSLYPMTGSCAEARAQMPKSMIIKAEDLETGDSVIWYYTDTGTGHVGVFQKWLIYLKTMLCTEGNTTAGKIGEAVVREGGGAYVTERSVNGYGSAVLKMCVRVFPKFVEGKVPVKEPVTTPVVVEDIKGSWNKPEWDAQILARLELKWALYDGADDVAKLHPAYSTMSKARRKKVWLEFFIALAKFESSWNPKSSSVDVGTQGDKGSWSVGLYQVSANDQSWAGGGTKYTVDELLTAGPNIHLAMILFERQLTKRDLIFLNNSDSLRYWAVALIGNKYSKITEILAYIKAKV